MLYFYVNLDFGIPFVCTKTVKAYLRIRNKFVSLDWDWILLVFLSKDFHRQ